MLLRHASAEIQGYNQEDDHEKPLDSQGKKDSLNLSNWLKRCYIDFELIISSNAKRAIQTSEIIFLPLNASIKKNSLFYLCGFEEIFSTIKDLDDTLSNVVIVGHEPSMSETMRSLVGSTRPDLEMYLNVSYQPCTMSFICFEKKNWHEVKEKEGLLEGYLNPSMVNVNNG